MLPRRRRYYRYSSILLIYRNYFVTKGLLYLLVCPIVLGPFISCFLTPHVNDDTVHGYAADEFKAVKEAFRRNFGEGLEREGAAVAIYYKGQKVVDLWGGWADKEAERKWKHETRTVLFSATKAISSLCIAVLVDRGYISYEDRVIDFWPEYGIRGKENTTVEHIMSHMAGLPFLDEVIDLADVHDFDRIRMKMENATPYWTPGTASGYHAVTFGFLIDAIVRKVDGRSLTEFFQQEIAEPHGLDIDIGSPNSHDVARITLPSLWEYIRDIIKNPKILPMLGIMYLPRPDPILEKIRTNTPWLDINFDTMPLNNPSILSLPLGAVTGISSAESLARLFSLTMDGTIISNYTLKYLQEPTLNSWHLEKVTLWPVAKGRGFFYEKHPLIPGAFTFGHPGYGGQFVHADPHTGLSIAYVSNGLKTGSGELCGPYMRLLRETYNSIRA